MKRAIPLIPCLLMATPAQAECTTPAVVAAVEPYTNCVQARGLQLEPSKESPENIAIAAISFCSSLKRAALSSLSPSCLLPEIRADIDKDMERRARNLVITRVVEKRASR